jgi:hypothetical protein
MEHGSTEKLMVTLLVKEFRNIFFFNILAAFMVTEVSFYTGCFTTCGRYCRR